MERLVDRLRPAAAVTFALVLALAAFAPLLHADETPRVENPHGKFREDCQLCHDARSWKSVHVSPKFDHSKYGFPLEGAHATSNCLGCHRSLDFAQSRAVCASCHQDPHRGEMGTECARCHGARSFVDRGPMVRAHQLTRFPLTGGHAALDCDGCHRPAAQGKLQFVGTPLECRACHMDQYRSAKDPDHVAGGYPTDCQGCHRSTGWSGATFDHAKTTFPLTGAHRSVACASCHVPGHPGPLRTDCAGCHQAAYDGASPPHNATAFPPALCATCHSTASWTTSFDHATTAFPLTGAHRSVTCTNCHGDGVYAGRSMACMSCHATTYAGASPPHTAATFPADACANCHSTTTWTTNFTHSSTFPLTGAHASVACATCHANGVYAGRGTACATCHASDYAGASPPHTAQAFPQAQCATCHTTSTWANASFNHTTNTSFPLTGAHAAVTCAGCHGDGVYAAKTVDCYGCHQNSSPGYATANDPPHTPALFPTSTAACTGCHTTTAWQPSTFSHARSSFPLTGAHSAVACTGCHNASTWATPGGTCYACHTSTYASAQPPHTPASFPTAQCATCHNTSSWPTTFNHTTGTSFPLTGAHATATCASCHGDGVYAAKTVDCYGCHQNSNPGYATATSPPHTPALFPTSTSACTGCHTTTAWQPSTFNHTNTTFPLTGAHPAVACTGCHNASTWATPGRDCYSCHSGDYAATLNPKHDPVNFPTAGCSCHNTTTWQGATNFDHTAAGFPLKGLHTVPPRACVDCHASGYTATSTACASCHTTSNPGYNTASPKHDAAHFPPANCATCHATAAASFQSWDGGAFPNHTWFNITTTRHKVPCMECHTSTTNLTLFDCSSACHSRIIADHDRKTTSCGTFSTANAVSLCYCCHPSGRAG